MVHHHHYSHYFFVRVVIAVAVLVGGCALRRLYNVAELIDGQMDRRIYERMK